jgi:hypothetical protein
MIEIPLIIIFEPTYNLFFIKLNLAPTLKVLTSTLKNPSSLKYTCTPIPFAAILVVVIVLIAVSNNYDFLITLSLMPEK